MKAEKRMEVQDYFVLTIFDASGGDCSCCNLYYEEVLMTFGRARITLLSMFRKTGGIAHDVQRKRNSCDNGNACRILVGSLDEAHNECYREIR
jgi:hypothetical protein